MGGQKKSSELTAVELREADVVLEDVAEKLEKKHECAAVREFANDNFRQFSQRVRRKMREIILLQLVSKFIYSLLE